MKTVIELQQDLENVNAEMRTEKARNIGLTEDIETLKQNFKQQMKTYA